MIDYIFSLSLLYHFCFYKRKEPISKHNLSEHSEKKEQLKKNLKRSSNNIYFVYIFVCIFLKRNLRWFWFKPLDIHVSFLFVSVKWPRTKAIFTSPLAKYHTFTYTNIIQVYQEGPTEIARAGMTFEQLQKKIIFAERTKEEALQTKESLTSLLHKLEKKYVS